MPSKHEYEYTTDNCTRLLGNMSVHVFQVDKHDTSAHRRCVAAGRWCDDFNNCVLTRDVSTTNKNNNQTSCQDESGCAEGETCDLSDALWGGYGVCVRNDITGQQVVNNGLKILHFAGGLYMKGRQIGGVVNCVQQYEDPRCAQRQTLR